MRVKDLIQKLSEFDPEADVEMSYTNRSTSYHSQDELIDTDIDLIREEYGTVYICEYSRLEE